jgi:hypothetical protein
MYTGPTAHARIAAALGRGAVLRHSSYKGECQYVMVDGWTHKACVWDAVQMHRLCGLEPFAAVM